MIIDVTNISTISYDILSLKKDALYLLSLLNYTGYGLSVTITDNMTIQKYNREYRNKDMPTDVLSFPFYPKLKAGESIAAIHEDEKHLGDIIISLEYVITDAQRWNQTVPQRMRVLLVHGICHLLGYDHIADEDYVIMKQKEDWLLHELDKRT